MLFDDLDVAAAPRELVALGGILDPPTLRAAYRNGVFPWPPSSENAAAYDRSMRRNFTRLDSAIPLGLPAGDSQSLAALARQILASDPAAGS